MPAVEASPGVSSESAGLVKMEDRKRSAAYDHNDAAPPLKKQATTVNGGSKPHPDADMPWKDDLERFQKDAIWRQMQEYKREKVALEMKLKETSRSSSYYQDHLRIIDAWFKQLIDEIGLLLGDAQDASTGRPSFQSALQFENVDNFEKHLTIRSEEIKQTITRLSSMSSKSSPEMLELQNQLARKLAEEKVIIADLEKALAEKQQLEESLEAASLRYMVAEKRLDRARSVTVAKLEKQYLMGAQQPEAASAQSKREDSAAANGATPSSEPSAELEEAHHRLSAVSAKQKEQLQKLEAENAKLTSQMTELNIKYSRLTDDDYAHTDLFKQIKSQYEDVVKRINHLEATNVRLREEAEKLRSERTAYRTQVDEETRATIAEKEAQLMRAETDLVRIRNTRDELLADQQVRKATQEQEKIAAVKIQELADARAAQISSLESELGRLRLQLENSTEAPQNLDEVPIEDLRTRFSTLERQYTMLNTELASMQMACKKYSTLASQKVADFSAMEEKVARLIAEKSKADQKYFAAMKSKEARDAEVRTLRMQNAKASDIVSQLKESEAATRSLLANMEKQISEGKEALNSLVMKNQAAQQRVTDSNITIESLKSQVNELKALLTSKDLTLANTSTACRNAETEVESLKATLADLKKSLEDWKNKSLGNSSSEYEMLRSLALCTVCRRNFKNTAIKTCGHVFCKDCVEERLTSRSRKCPNCNKSFGSNDHMHITL